MAKDGAPAPQKKVRRKSNSDRWKAIEIAIANIIGGERIPVTGRIFGSAPDIECSWLSPEVKHGKHIPALFVKALSQAVASATGKRVGRIPIVFMHAEGAKIGDTIVMFRLSDFWRLIRTGARHLPKEPA